MRIFLFFFLLTSLLFPFPNANFPGQSTLTNIDFTTIKALKSIDRAIEKKQLFGNVTITQVYLSEGKLSKQEITYFAQKMSDGFHKISEGTINFSEDSFEKMDANLKERVKNQTSPKKVQTPYFSHLIIKNGRDFFSLTMVIFETATKKEIWSKSWQNFSPTRKQYSDEETSSNKYANLARFVSDAGVIVYIDDFYFFGLSTSAAAEVANIVTIGINLGTLFSVTEKLSTRVRVNNVDYDVNADVFGAAISLSGLLGFSLINSHQRNFDIFDLELQFEGGILFGSIDLTGTISTTGLIIPFKEENNRIWRPIIMFGLNFVFIERIYVRAGVDFGRMVRNPETLRNPKTDLTPFVALGYRFDSKHWKR